MGVDVQRTLDARRALPAACARGRRCGAAAASSTRLVERAVAARRRRSAASVTPPDDGISRSRPAASAGDPVVDRAPVGDDETLEAPLVAQHLGEQPRVLRRVDAVDPVVRAHHRPRLRVLRRRAGSRAGRSRAAGAGRRRSRTRMRSFSWLLAAKCLSEAPTPVDCDAPHERGAEHAGDDRVLGEVLEVAAAQRRALDVDARAEQHGDVLDRGLDAERLADALGELGVPRRAERHRRREAGRRHAVADAEVVGAPPLLAQAVRAVGEHDATGCRRARRLGRPEAGAAGERGLLLQREVGDDAAAASWIVASVMSSSFSFGRADQEGGAAAVHRVVSGTP